MNELTEGERIDKIWENVKKFYRENYTKVDTSNHSVKCKITEYKPLPQPNLSLFEKLHNLKDRNE